MRFCQALRYQGGAFCFWRLSETCHSLNGTGNVPFSTYSPFGYSGRFVYGKATVKF